MALTKVIGNGLGAVTQDGAATFNEGSADVDFRVESNGNANMLFIDGGNDLLGIKTATPSNYYADDLVLTAPDEGGMTIVQGTGHRGYLAFADGTSGSQAYRGYISYDHNDDTLYLGTDGGGKLLIDTTGAVTMPLQPAFSAGRSSTLANFATGSQVVINLNNEIYDQNGDFSDPNFTAPVTGKYQLSAVFYMNALDISADYYILRIATSNRSYDHVVDSSARDEDETYSSYTISVLADMDVNDTAQISLFQQGGAAQTDITGGTYFTGFLAC